MNRRVEFLAGLFTLIPLKFEVTPHLIKTGSIHFLINCLTGFAYIRMLQTVVKSGVQWSTQPHFSQNSPKLNIGASSSSELERGKRLSSRDLENALGQLPSQDR